MFYCFQYHNYYRNNVWASKISKLKTRETEKKKVLEKGKRDFKLYKVLFVWPLSRLCGHVHRKFQCLQDFIVLLFLPVRLGYLIFPLNVWSFFSWSSHFEPLPFCDRVLITITLSDTGPRGRMACYRRPLAFLLIDITTSSPEKGYLLKLSNPWQRFLKFFF